VPGWMRRRGRRKGAPIGPNTHGAASPLSCTPNIPIPSSPAAARLRSRRPSRSGGDFGEEGQTLQQPRAQFTRWSTVNGPRLSRRYVKDGDADKNTSWAGISLGPYPSAGRGCFSPSSEPFSFSPSALLPMPVALVQLPPPP
jgi:hypothetical protein